MHQGLLKAIRYFGTQQALAKALGVKQQAISNWLNREADIPYLQVLNIVRATKGHVTHLELAPFRRSLNEAIDDLVKILGKRNSTEAQCDSSFNADTATNPISSQQPPMHLQSKSIRSPIARKLKGRNNMREYAKISSRFWSEVVRKEMKALGSDIIVISLYVQTCKHANMIGIYHLPLPYICYDTGISEERVLVGLKYLEHNQFCSYDQENEYIWVRDMAFEQIAEELDVRDKRVKSINNLFHSLPDLPFLKDFYLQYRDHFHLTDFDSDNQIKENDFEEAPLSENFITNENLSSTSSKTSDGDAIKLSRRSPFEGPCKGLRSQEQELEQEQNREQEQKQRYLSGKPDVSIPKNLFHEKKSISSQQQLDKDALAILEFLNQKTKSTFRPVESNLQLIKSRLASGVTIIQCRQVIAKKTREWRDNARMKSYLRPATLFNPVNFEQYLGELVAADQFEDEVYES